MSMYVKILGNSKVILSQPMVIWIRHPGIEKIHTEYKSTNLFWKLEWLDSDMRKRERDNAKLPTQSVVWHRDRHDK